MSKAETGTINTTDHTAKALSFAIKIFLSILFLGALVFGGINLVKSYNGKIIPHLAINGTDLGNRSQDEARTIITDQANKRRSQELTILYNDKTFNPKLSDLGVSFDVDGAVQEAVGYGRIGSTLTRLKDISHILVEQHEITLSPTFDETELNEYFNKINQEIYIEPVNASLKYKDGQFALIPAQSGQGFDKDKLKEDILASINGDQAPIKLNSTILTPKIPNDNTGEAKNKALSYLKSSPINLTFEDKTFTVTENDITAWIDFNAKGDQLEAIINDDQLNKYIDSIAPRIEIPKIDREIIKDSGKVAIEGQDGRAVDRNQLTSDIKKSLQQNQPNSSIAIQTFVKPKEVRQVAAVFTPSSYAGRYIEVNLSSQTLYAFENNQVVNHFLISGGLKAHPTITGIFYVYAKSRVTEMKGEGYDLPNVQWVSWWSGDYSIHGTYWHNNFGHPMSHGCINASNANAQWVYNWDSIGTPVWVHW